MEPSDWPHESGEKKSSEMSISHRIPGYLHAIFTVCIYTLYGLQMLWILGPWLVSAYEPIGDLKASVVLSTSPWLPALIFPTWLVFLALRRVCRSPGGSNEQVGKNGAPRADEDRLEVAGSRSTARLDGSRGERWLLRFATLHGLRRSMVWSVRLLMILAGTVQILGPKTPVETLERGEVETERLVYTGPLYEAFVEVRSEGLEQVSSRCDPDKMRKHVSVYVSGPMLRTAPRDGMRWFGLDSDPTYECPKNMCMVAAGSWYLRVRTTTNWSRIDSGCAPVLTANRPYYGFPPVWIFLLSLLQVVLILYLPLVSTTLLLDKLLGVIRRTVWNRS
jgi:hypothetical protein